MAGLQRSSETFRRSGSSGLVWEDRFLTEEMNTSKLKEEEVEYSELRQSHSAGSLDMMERSRSTGGGRAYRTGRVSPALDPPSPKLSGCGLCGIFTKPHTSRQSKPRRR